MIPFALQVILLLLALGGVIAYLGNYVGRYIGKRRLSFLRLRPRYTAMVITIISGTIIALSTLAIVLVISQDARTAFLGMEKIRQQIDAAGKELRPAKTALNTTQQQQRELTANLQQAQKEIGQLQTIKKNLSQEIAFARKGELLFRNGEAITISLIQAGPDQDKITDGLNKIIAAADRYLRSLGGKEKIQTIQVAAEDQAQAVEQLSAGHGQSVVKLVASRNVIWGEPVLAKLELQENKLIYKKGALITELDIVGGLSLPEAEQQVLQLLRAAHDAAKTAGVLPDPTGSLGSVPYAQISELAKRIKLNSKNLTLKALSGTDVYTIGPLSVTFRISYQ